MCAQDLVAQKLEALRQEKALAAEMEQQLKDLNAQRAEVLNKQPSCYSATINWMITVTLWSGSTTKRSTAEAL